MAIEIIKIGALPNDGLGDPLRVAFAKINNNFALSSNTTVAAGTDGSIQFRSTNSLRSIAYYKPASPATAAGIYVAAGAPGRLFTSDDALNWTEITSPTENTINQIISTPTGFIAVGDNGTIISSADAVTWYSIPSFANNNDLYSINLSSSGTYTIVGSNGLILTSTNASTWTSATSGTTNNLRSITSIPGQWVAVGDLGTILYSANSNAWTQSTANGIGNANINGITYGTSGNGGNYYTAGADGRVLRSSDGIIWNVTAGVATVLNLSSIVAANVSINDAAPVPRVVAVGANGIIATTADSGVTWTTSSVVSSNLNSVTYTANTLYTVGNNGTIASSLDAATWANVSIPGTLEGNVNFTYDEIGSNVLVNANIIPQSNNEHTLGTANLRFDSGYFSSTGIHTDAIAIRGNATTLNVGFSGDANLFADVKAANLELTANLTVNGNASFGNANTVHIAGGTDGFALKTDGNGNLRWDLTTTVSSNISNVVVPVIAFDVEQTISSTDTVVFNAPVGPVQFLPNAAVAFTGSVVGGLTANVTYFVKDVVQFNEISLSATLGGNVISLTDSNGGFTLRPVSTTVTMTNPTSIITGSTVKIVDVVGPTQLNGNVYYARSTSANAISLFSDANLTIPVNSITNPAYVSGGRVLISQLNYVGSNGGGGGGNVVSIPPIYFSASANGNNQSFTDPTLALYASNTDITLFLNGSLLENEFYVLNDSTLTVTTPLTVGDSVDIPRQFAANVISPGGNGTPGGTDTQVQFNDVGAFGGNVGFTFNKTTGVLTSPFVAGNGNGLSNIQVANVVGLGNIATIALDGSSANVLYGNGVWAPAGGGNGTPGGTNTQLQFNNNGNFGGISTVTYDGNLLTLGDASNITIGGGTVGQLLSFDINGTLTWVNPAATSYGNANVQTFLESGNLAGNIIPSGNKVYDLGSATNRFRDVYLSNNTIFLGEAQISASGSNLLYNSLPIASTTTNGDMSLGGNLGASSLAATVSISSPLVELGGVPLAGANGNITYDGLPLVSTNANGAISITGNIEAGNLIANTSLTVPTISLAGIPLSGANGNITYDGLPLVSTNVNGDTELGGNLTANAIAGNSLVVSGPATIAGNLAVTGNTTFTDVTNVNVEDPIIQLGGGPNGAPLTVNDGLDRGTLLHYYTTQPIDAFMGWKNGASEFVFASNSVNNNNVVTINQLGNVRAGNFIGNFVGNFSANTAVTVTANAQPNITSVGTLTGLVVVGNTTLGSNANLRLTGGSNGQVLATDGNGNLSWATAAGSLTVGTLDAANAFINSYSNITKLGFDTDSGFDVTDLGNGLARVAMNSTFKFWEVNGQPGITAEGLDTVNFITDGSIQITPSNVSTPKSMTFAANIAAISAAVGGNIAVGNIGEIQIAGANRSLSATPKLKFDSTSNLFSVVGNISVAGIETRLGNDTFSRSLVYGAITNNTNPDQKIWGVDANTVAGVDFNIISTDELGGSRQITKLSAVTFGADIAYNETSTIILNQFLANWYVGLGNGQVELYVSPMTANTVSTKMEIIIYNP